MATDDSTCVACGLPVTDDQSPVMEMPMHRRCFEIGIEMFYSGRYGALTGEELRAVIRLRALKEAEKGESR